MTTDTEALPPLPVHDHRVVWDRPCCKCRQHTCDGSCAALTAAPSAQAEPVAVIHRPDGYEVVMQGGRSVMVPYAAPPSAQAQPQEQARKAYGKLLQLAAEWAQRKPLDNFAHLDGVSHIGHRQFAAAYGPAYDLCASYAVRLRDAADELMKAAQPQEPPRSAPLTEEQINQLSRDCYDGRTNPLILFARAIEAAHGISTPEEQR